MCGHLYPWLTCIIVLAVTGCLVGQFVSTTQGQLGGVGFLNRAKDAKCRVVGCMLGVKLIAISYATVEQNCADLTNHRTFNHAASAIGVDLLGEDGIAGYGDNPIRRLTSLLPGILEKIMSFWSAVGVASNEGVYSETNVQCWGWPEIFHIKSKSGGRHVFARYPECVGGRAIIHQPRSLTGNQSIMRNSIGHNHLLKLAFVDTSDADANHENGDFGNELPSRKPFPPWRCFGVMVGTAGFVWGWWVLRLKRDTTERTAILGIIFCLGGVILAFWSV